MGARPPKTDPDLVRRTMVQRLERYERGPFLEMTAKFLRNGPTEDAISAKAQKDPESWARSLRHLAVLGGYTEKTEHTRVELNAADVVRTLVARVGPEQARIALQAQGATGLLTLIPEPVTIEGEAVEVG